MHARWVALSQVLTLQMAKGRRNEKREFLGSLVQIPPGGGANCLSRNASKKREGWEGGAAGKGTDYQV